MVGALRCTWARLAAGLVAVGLVLAAASPASGQVVRGYVLDDSTEVGLADVEVAALVDSVPVARAVSDRRGHFVLELPDPATVQLEGRRLGWRTVLSQPLQVAAGDTVSVELWMGVHVIPVAPLYVTARSNLGRSRFFRHMEEWGRGVFITPDQVDSIAPIHPVDVLRGQEETWLSWRQGARGQVPDIRSLMGHGCVKFMIDRLEVRSWTDATVEVAGGDAFEETALETLDGRKIVAVEYYRYPGEAPPELRRYLEIEPELGVVKMCGLVVYWTKEGW